MSIRPIWSACSAIKQPIELDRGDQRPEARGSLQIGAPGRDGGLDRGPARARDRPACSVARTSTVQPLPEPSHAIGAGTRSPSERFPQQEESTTSRSIAQPAPPEGSGGHALVTLDGRYHVVERIASGGMGEVFRARDTVLAREVAIKVLHRSLAGDQAFVDRFRREARAAAGLSHPNIVAVFDWGSVDGIYYMVMEYVRGQSRARAPEPRTAASSPPRPPTSCARPCSALEHAHRQGIVHRDIKPENVLVTTEGVVKVADFGLARAYADGRQTQAGTVTGTVQYLAPEQIRGEPADPRSDLYSLGIVTYELLTGKLPFTGETAMSIAYKHLSGRVPRPSAAVPSIPADLDGFVASATDRDRELRPDRPPRCASDLEAHRADTAARRGRSQRIVDATPGRHAARRTAAPDRRGRRCPTCRPGGRHSTPRRSPGSSGRASIAGAGASACSPWSRPWRRARGASGPTWSPTEPTCPRSRATPSRPRSRSWPTSASRCGSPTASTPSRSPPDHVLRVQPVPGHHAGTGRDRHAGALPGAAARDDPRDRGQDRSSRRGICSQKAGLTLGEQTLRHDDSVPEGSIDRDRAVRRAQGQRRRTWSSARARRP